MWLPVNAAAGPAVTVRAVCRQAGLTERYFYESFTDRDEFVRASTTTSARGQCRRWRPPPRPAMRSNGSSR